MTTSATLSKTPSGLKVMLDSGAEAGDHVVRSMLFRPRSLALQKSFSELVHIFYKCAKYSIYSLSYASVAQKLFKLMQQNSLSPNEVFFVAFLWKIGNVNI